MEISSKELAGRRIMRVMLLTAVFSAMSVLTFNIVLPELRKEFQIDLSQASWLSSGYLLVYAIGSVVYGKLANRFRLKNLFTVVLPNAFRSKTAFRTSHCWSKGGERGMTNLDSSAMVATVQGWDGVSLRPHRFGGTEFVVNGREIGHIHGVSLVDLMLPKATRDEAIRSGKAIAHHVLPESNWVSVPLRTETDVSHALELLRFKYELLVSS